MISETVPQESPSLVGYWAHPERESILIRDLRKQGVTIVKRVGRFFLCEGPSQKLPWVTDIWERSFPLSFHSISEASQKLQTLAPSWKFYGQDHFRRGMLISEKIRKKNLDSREKPKSAYTLIDKNTLIYTPRVARVYGEAPPQYKENRTQPPNRAYLKLWELFDEIGARPQKGALCLDFGGSPGGWAWVLSPLGAKVITVDRAPYDPHIRSLKNVTVRKLDAFKVKASGFEKIDWFFWDVICFPERLLETLKPWLHGHPKTNFVCTLKFKGEPNPELIQKFLNIPHSQLIHLWSHKNELAWIRLHSP